MGVVLVLIFKKPWLNALMSLTGLRLIEQAAGSCVNSAKNVAENNTAR